MVQSTVHTVDYSIYVRVPIRSRSIILNIFQRLSFTKLILFHSPFRCTIDQHINTLHQCHLTLLLHL